ncbi:MAG: hypothetical protein MRERV_1c098 [Mycoplasmataceae bacterium RV_VA103A]|nr:MAG: hypothetical protein MRERV_10c012 [Mycoplasmataceae bacterium RV_VA103A]KLL05414.1 MAG: hypothetical protein MRERV_1c098 [Mycoplasmataceae bacterium RV_VA103A]
MTRNFAVITVCRLITVHKKEAEVVPPLQILTGKIIKAE